MAGEFNGLCTCIVGSGGNYQAMLRELIGPGGRESVIAPVETCERIGSHQVIEFGSLDCRHLALFADQAAG